MHARQLQAFLTVVEIGSFTRAAARLGVSQPTITSRVRALEEDVGAALLERLPSGIHLTEAGRNLIPYAHEIIGLMARARDAVRAGGQPHGHVTVASVESLTNYRLLPLIEYIYVRYPGLDVSFLASTYGDTLSRVRDGQSDCAFFIDAEFQDPELEVEVLCPEPLVLVVGADHPLAGQAAVTVEDLQSTTLIRSEFRSPYFARFERMLADPPQDRRVIDLDSLNSAKGSVARGLGMTLLPRLTVTEELTGGSLSEVDWQPPFTTFSQVAWRRRRPRHQALQLVIEAAAKVVREEC